MSGNRLIRAFFVALQRRELERCAALLSRLERLSATRPLYRPWVDYLAGVLANERDHDWAAAERQFQAVIGAEAEPELHCRALFALGRTYDYQGRWDEAINTFKRHLALAGQLGEPIEEAKAWKHLAISYHKGFTRGMYSSSILSQAIAYCHQALDTLTPIAEVSDNLALLVGSVWNTLGALHMSEGKLDQAQDCYRRDLAICRERSDSFGVALSLHNLGEIASQRGPTGWQTALASYEEALDLLRSLAQPELYEEIDILANLAYLHQQMGHTRQALDYYEQSIGAIEGLRNRASSAEAQAGFFATTVEIYAHAILLTIQAGDLERAFDYTERARVWAFIDLLIRAGADQSLAAGEPSQALNAIQAALSDEAILLAYFTTGTVEARGNPRHQRYRFPPERTLIFAITRTDVQVHDAGISPNVLSPAQRRQVVEDHFLEPAVRRMLYDRLIGPVAALAQGRRRLYIVPHGPLHSVPFGALLAPDGACLLNPEGPQLMFGLSASFLLAQAKWPVGSTPWRSLSLGYNGSPQHPLRYAEDEALMIARLTGGDAQVGAEPKLPFLFAKAMEYRLLHFSCHGLFDPDHPLRSALYLAPGEELTALEVLTNLHLRCDLVILSACESGLSQVRRGDELVGLLRAFLQAGARAVIVTLWRVDELATRLLMEHLYGELLAGTPTAEALRRAQVALMRMSRREAAEALAGVISANLLSPEGAQPDAAPAPKSTRRKQPAPSITPNDNAQANDTIFADPYYWAPFMLVGDPDLKSPV